MKDFIYGILFLILILVGLCITSYNPKGFYPNNIYDAYIQKFSEDKTMNKSEKELLIKNLQQLSEIEEYKKKILYESILERKL